MIIFIISIFPFALVFGIGLALHCWVSFHKQMEEAETEEMKNNKIREQHREQAKSDMAEMSVYAAYYGGYTYENSNQ